MFEQALHRWLTTVLRNNPTTEDIDDCLSLLGFLSRHEKRSFWQWLSQNDPNLKKWLTQQGEQRQTSTKSSSAAQLSLGSFVERGAL